MIKRFFNIFLILGLMFIVLAQASLAFEYQFEVDRYTDAIHDNVNELPDWNKGFEKAKKNIESLEQCLHNISMEIKEKRKSDPNYTVEIILLNPVFVRIASLEIDKATVKAYLTKLQNDYMDMTEGRLKNESRIITNVGKAMTKWARRIGKPSIQDLDFSEEKKDAKILENDIKNINDLPDMMKYNRKEYRRMLSVYNRLLDMIEKIEPLNERMKQILEKYKDIGKKEQLQLSSVKFNGTYKGKTSTSSVMGQIILNISGSTVSGKHWGTFYVNKDYGPLKGTWNGAYDPTTNTLKGDITGNYSFTTINRSLSPGKIRGIWKASFVEQSNFKTGKTELILKGSYIIETSRGDRFCGYFSAKPSK
ncbi:MAG: hypothetical protein ABIH00_01935 [Armatimonadota bacterium]